MFSAIKGGTTVKTTEIKLGDIVINQSHLLRKELGSVEELASSISEGRYVPPIVINETDGELVTGQRTYEAYKRLGHEEVIVRVGNFPDLESRIEEQLRENTNRKELTREEQFRASELFFDRETEAAKERRGKKVESCPEADFGKTRDRVADKLGISGRQLDKLRYVFRKADEDPEHYQEFAVGLNRDGKVDRAFKKVRTREKRLEIQARAAASVAGEELPLYTGEFRDHEDKIPDEGVDFFLVDPPYDLDSIPLYGQIAELASRKLRPGGLLASYSGVGHLPDILREMAEHLNFLWIFSLNHTGTPGQPRFYKFRCGWKPITLWGKIPVDVWWDPAIDVIQGTREKDFHDWQQGQSEAEWLISQFSLPGTLVVDCVCGSGTTLAAAQKLGRRWIGIDKDPEAILVARGRLLGTTSEGESSSSSTDEEAGNE